MQSYVRSASVRSLLLLLIALACAATPAPAGDSPAPAPRPAPTPALGAAADVPQEPSDERFAARIYYDDVERIRLLSFVDLWEVNNKRER